MMGIVMKKTLPLFLLITLLTGCAGFELPDITQLLATPTPVIPADTPTIQPTVTLIPTRDLFAVSTNTPVTHTPTETSRPAKGTIYFIGPPAIAYGWSRTRRLSCSAHSANTHTSWTTC